MAFEEHEQQAYVVDCTNLGIKDVSLNNYYCVCCKLVLIVNKPIQKLPLRKTDGARVLDSNKHFYKIYTELEPETVHILRKKGVEKQFRLKCVQCKLPVFYKHDTTSGVTFILKNAVFGRINTDEGDKEESQKSTSGVVIRDTKTKIGGVRMSSYRENYKIIKQALQKQRK